MRLERHAFAGPTNSMARAFSEPALAPYPDDFSEAAIVNVVSTTASDYCRLPFAVLPWAEIFRTISNERTSSHTGIRLPAFSPIAIASVVRDERINSNRERGFEAT
jgi:hypothetical protein